MSRPARALLDTRALRHNLGIVRRHAPAARVMAVVKANAYGHGLNWAAGVLHDVDAFGVASVEEGMQLRRAGVLKPICLLEGFFGPDDLPLLARHNLSPVIHHDAQLAMLEAGRGLPPLSVWLKIDTGMHRLGFAPEAFPGVYARLKACGCTSEIRLLSHFANADVAGDKATGRQIERFEALRQQARTEASLANSAGIVAWPASHHEWVRPGIMLYGASPLAGRSAATLDLKPVMTLASALIAVHRRAKGDAIGYGGDYVCPEDMPVGVVAIGYGDGYPRHAPSGTPVLVNGRREPLVGRVSMDMITLDLRNQPNARVGDPVVLWGEGLPVDEIAARAGTISYELLCHVAERIPRVMVSETDSGLPRREDGRSIPA
jgi:alanine racemase